MEQDTPPIEERGIVWLVLDDDSQAALKRRFPGAYDHYYGHHCTLAFGVNRQAYEAIIGTTAMVSAYALARSGSAEAVRIETSGLPDTYGVPHITISTPEGIPPFASVAMLQNQHEETAIEPPLTLSGRIEYTPFQSGMSH